MVCRRGDPVELQRQPLKTPRKPPKEPQEGRKRVPKGPQESSKRAPRRRKKRRSNKKVDKRKMRSPGGRRRNVKVGLQGAFGCPISLPERPLMRFSRCLEMPKKLIQECKILEGLAFWNVIFRPRRASKTKQVLREYCIFAHMKARLYRKT